MKAEFSWKKIDAPPMIHHLKVELESNVEVVASVEYVRKMLFQGRFFLATDPLDLLFPDMYRALERLCIFLLAEYEEKDAYITFRLKSI